MSSKDHNMSREQLATLCALLNRFDSIVDMSMKGALETAFDEVWEAGRKSSSTLVFYRAVLESSKVLE